MEEDKLALQEQQESRLTDNELLSYRAYMKSGHAPMAASTAAQFFHLYLNGSSCEEIRRLNPLGFPLGAIVRARIENNWDKQLEDHRNELMDRVREHVQQITMETVERIKNEMAASNKLTNDRVLKFLQTGDQAELAGTGVGSTRHLKDMLEMLMKLTGQDQKKQTQVGGLVQHHHTVETKNEAALPIVPAGKALTATVASDVLAAIHKARQKQ